MTNRLTSRIAARADYVVLVGVPVDAPARWARASSYTADELVTPEGRIPADAVRAFVIAYPNLQILDAELRRLPLPDGFTWLRGDPFQERARTDVEGASAGLQIVDVRYSPSPTHPHAVDHYCTTLVNLGEEPVRILEFGAYVEVDGRYELNTVTGQLFSAAEFVAWYGAPADGWIAPGAEVTDPDNYGARPVLWAYHCETRRGTRFVTGRVLARA